LSDDGTSSESGPGTGGVPDGSSSSPGPDAHAGPGGSISDGKKQKKTPRWKVGCAVIIAGVAVGAAIASLIGYNPFKGEEEEALERVDDHIERTDRRAARRRASGTPPPAPAPQRIDPVTGRPEVNMENLGLGTWQRAQNGRESAGAPVAGKNESGWDTYYDPMESPFGPSLGAAGARTSLRIRGIAATDITSLSETLKFETEPFRNLRGDDGLRFILFAQHLDATYERGSYPDLSTDELRLMAGVEKYFGLGRHKLKVGLGVRSSKWTSEGGNAPDRIEATLLGANISWLDTQTGVQVMLRLYGGDGDYDATGLTDAVDVDDFLAAVKWDVPGRESFYGAEFQSTSGDYHGAMQTNASRITLFGGTRGIRGIDELATGLSLIERDNTVGDDYSRWGIEERATWYLGKKGWIRANLFVREPTPENKDAGDNVEVGLGVGGGVSF
jgi:hypothetical protein